MQTKQMPNQLIQPLTGNQVFGYPYGHPSTNEINYYPPHNLNQNAHHFSQNAYQQPECSSSNSHSNKITWQASQGSWTVNQKQPPNIVAEPQMKAQNIKRKNVYIGNQQQSQNTTDEADKPKTAKGLTILLLFNCL